MVKAAKQVKIEIEISISVGYDTVLARSIEAEMHSIAQAEDISDILYKNAYGQISLEYNDKQPEEPKDDEKSVSSDIGGDTTRPV